jgi:hypothetical protein
MMTSEDRRDALDLINRILKDGMPPAKFARVQSLARDLWGKRGGGAMDKPSGSAHPPTFPGNPSLLPGDAAFDSARIETMFPMMYRQKPRSGAY